jgi:hypothetical protein
VRDGLPLRLHRVCPLGIGQLEFRSSFRVAASDFVLHWGGRDCHGLDNSQSYPIDAGMVFKIDHLLLPENCKKIEMHENNLPLNFKCPTCAAAPREKCVLNGGSPRFQSHIQRWETARDHSWIGSPPHERFCRNTYSLVLKNVS